MKKNPDKIDWGYLCENPNPEILSMLEPIIENEQDEFDPTIHWDYLSENPNAISLLEKNQDKLWWCRVAENPNAIHLLEQNLDKLHIDITWWNVSMNPNAVHILEKNQKNIDWEWFSANPNIFEFDKVAMKKQMQPLAEELVAMVFHPNRVRRILNKYKYNILSDEYWFDCDFKI